MAFRKRVVERASAFVEARKLNVRRIKHYYNRIVLYVRTDLKEIAFPSSLPDPPGYKPKPRARLKNINWKVLKAASVMYKQTWTGEYSEPGYNENKEEKKKRDKKKEEPSTFEELVAAAQLGGEHLKPALQRIYMAKLAVYRDALRHFVDGYKQGLKETIDKTKSSGDAEQQKDAASPGRKEGAKKPEQGEAEAAAAAAAKTGASATKCDAAEQEKAKCPS